jgi:hypothetical protein
MTECTDREKLIREGYVAVGSCNNIEYLCKHSELYSDQIVYRLLDVFGRELRKGNHLHVNINEIDLFVLMKMTLNL